jgi:Mu-like prophage I protein
MRLSFQTSKLEGPAPSEIVFVPMGKNTVTCSISGKPKTVTVTALRSTADKLNSDLQAALAKSLAGEMSVPFLDFQHEAGRASAHPVEFVWDEVRGIVLKLEWTPSGRAAVEGKEFLYFSPEVDWNDKTQQIVGLIQPGPVGGLTNLPAFQTQTRLAAELQPTTPMPEILKLMIAKGFLAADATEITPESVTALAAKLDSAASDMTCAKATIADITTERDALKASLAKVNDTAAESFVTEQLKAGRITEESKPVWLARAKADLKEATTLLASFKVVSGAPNGVVLTAATPTDSRKRDLFQSMQSESDPVKRAKLYSEWEKL